MGIANNIKMLRQSKGWTQEQLADKVGVSRSTVTQWETGWSSPRMGAVKKLAKVFDVSTSELVSETLVNESSYSSFVEVPMYGSIAAGTPIEMMESDGSEPVRADVMARYPGAFLLRVDGESMNRILPNGCYALVDPCEVVEHPMEPYAVCVNGHDATVKRVRALNNGFELVPDSTDPTYKPTVYDYGVEGTDVVTVIGRVVYYVLPCDWEF